MKFAFRFSIMRLVFLFCCAHYRAFQKTKTYDGMHMYHWKSLDGNHCIFWYLSLFSSMNISGGIFWSQLSLNCFEIYHFLCMLFLLWWEDTLTSLVHQMVSLPLEDLGDLQLWKITYKINRAFCTKLVKLNNWCALPRSIFDSSMKLHASNSVSCLWRGLL